MKKIMTWVLMVCFIGATLAPGIAYGQNQSTPKEEVIYINLDDYGQVKNIQVVNSFDLGDDGQIVDYGDYEALRNLSTEDTIDYEHETIRIDTNAKKLYYQGTLKNDSLPWTIHFDYYLDGKKVQVEQLKGAEGHLAIEGTMEQNPKGNSIFFDNYALQTTISLDTTRVENIQYGHATAANVGKKKQLVYTKLPGKDQTIRIEGDVKDFYLDPIEINGIQMDMDIDVDIMDNRDFQDSMDELKDAAVEFDDGADDLTDGSDELYDGANDLVDGADELNDGANDLKDGVQEALDGSIDLEDGAIELQDGTVELKDGGQELVDGTNDLVDGVNDLVDGVDELQDGTSDLQDGSVDLVIGLSKINDGSDDLVDGTADLEDGAASLESGLDQLSSKSDTLRGGAYSVYQTLVAQGNAQLNAALSSKGLGTVSLTVSNYEDVIGGLLDQLAQGVASQVEAGYKAQVETAVTQGVRAEVESNVRAQMPEADEATITATIDTMMAEAETQQMIAEETQRQLDDITATAMESNDTYKALHALLKGLRDYDDFYDGVVSYTGGVDQAYGGSQQVAGGASKLHRGAKDLADGVSEAYNGSAKLSQGLDDLADGVVELKDGVADLQEGSEDLNDGTIELSDGIIELSDGALDLVDGTKDLHEGMIELMDGAIELSDGTATLLDGTIEMRDGVIELKDGVIELKDGTLEFKDRTETMDQEIGDKITNAIEETLGTDFIPVSFVSEKNTNVKQVQFAMKTDGIKQADDNKDAQKEATKVTKKTDNPGFIKRFLALF